MALYRAKWQACVGCDLLMSETISQCKLEHLALLWAELLQCCLRLRHLIAEFDPVDPGVWVLWVNVGE